MIVFTDPIIVSHSPLNFANVFRFFIRFIEYGPGFLRIKTSRFCSGTMSCVCIICLCVNICVFEHGKERLPAIKEENTKVIKQIDKAKEGFCTLINGELRDFLKNPIMRESKMTLKF